MQGLCAQHHVTVAFAQLQLLVLPSPCGIRIHSATADAKPQLCIRATESSSKVVLIRADWQREVLFNVSADLLKMRWC